MTKSPNGHDPDGLAAPWSDDPVDVYLREMDSVPPLSAEREIELAKIIERGGRDGERARKDLLEANLRLPVDIAREYASRDLHVLDLIQVGNNALLKALGQFDYKRGRRVAVYAAPWIRRAILRELRKKRGST